MGTSQSDAIENDSYSVLVPELFPCWGGGGGQTMQPTGSLHLVGIVGFLQTQRQCAWLRGLGQGWRQGRLPEKAAPEWF